MSVNTHQLSNNELYNWQKKRWKARTDLTYLAREVLGYKDVIGPERFPFLNRLQRFPLPTFDQLVNNDKPVHGIWRYTPITPLYDLPAGRRVLILDPRGFLKTTINAQSHSIQWILNYPDIAMMIIQSNSEKAESILGEIKRHFQANQTFRALFPEHCPVKRPFDWGTKAAFTTEARDVGTAGKKEETLMTGSIDKGSAGYHFDVMKFSDIVEPNNVKTPEQIRSVIDAFSMFENLLVRPDSWIDVEGTRYDFSDLYGELIKAEYSCPKCKDKFFNCYEKVDNHMADVHKLPPKRRRWSIHVRGVYRKQTPDGAPETFAPHELDFPYLKDEKGDKISWWPERWTVQELEDRRVDPARGEYVFACQQLNNPTDVGESQVAFPVSDKVALPKWISRTNFRMNVRVTHRTMSVDTAETQNERSNLSAITIVAWDQAGRAYLDYIAAGKWLPDALVDEIFKAAMLHSPQTVKIEETSFVRGLMATINRRMQLSGIYLPLEFIRRETNISKKERILNTLQPWYRAGDLRFVDDIDHKDELIEELRRFPRYLEDDIIDSLADHFQGKEYFGRLQARPDYTIVSAASDVNPWKTDKNGSFIYTEQERNVILQRSFERVWDIKPGPPEPGDFMPVPGQMPDYYRRTGGL